MSKNQPRCHCGGEMKRNGTTSKGTTRWRCKQCGASSVKRRNDITNAAVFTQFIEHCTTAISLDDLAKRNGVSRATMKRRFKWCWLVDVPDPTAGHHKRIYDQVFLDGTYTAGGCLIVAATIDHVGLVWFCGPGVLRVVGCYWWCCAHWRAYWLGESQPSALWGCSSL